MSWHFITASRWTFDSRLILPFRFHFWANARPKIQGLNVRGTNVVARRDISERAILKRTPGFGCHLLHGPGTSRWLDSVGYVLHDRFQMHWQKSTPSSLYSGTTSNRFFIPTYSCCLFNRFRDRSYDKTQALRLVTWYSSETETKVRTVRCERSQVRLFNDPPTLNWNCMRNLISKVQKRWLNIAFTRRNCKNDHYKTQNGSDLKNILIHEYFSLFQLVHLLETTFLLAINYTTFDILFSHKSH